MKKFTDKINESTFYKKVPSETLKYFDLFPLLRGLESERTGIKKRVWEWMCDEWDAASKPYNGRISSINLFFYGIGDEYPNDYLNQYPDELENCKKIHPEAFIEGRYWERVWSLSTEDKNGKDTGNKLQKSNFGEWGMEPTENIIHILNIIEKDFKDEIKSTDYEGFPIYIDYYKKVEPKY